MRILFFIFSFYFPLANLLGQVKINCSIIDSSGNIYYGYTKNIDLVKIQGKVVIKFDSLNTKTYSASQLKAFDYFPKNDTTKYQTVIYNGNKILLELSYDGAFLKECVYYSVGSRNHYHSQLVFLRDGKSIIKENGEADNILFSRVVSDYPLLFNMAKNNLIDITSGYEGKAVLDEYNLWRQSNNINKFKDTSIVLRAILDANKNYKSKKYTIISGIFFFSTFPLVFIGDIAAFIMANKEPKTKNLGLPDTDLTSNKTFLRIYKLRAHTQKTHACLKGVFLN